MDRVVQDKLTLNNRRPDEPMPDAGPSGASTPPPASTVPSGTEPTEPLAGISDEFATRLRVGYVYEEQMALHRQHPAHGTHPESPERITRVHEIFATNSLLKVMKRLPIRPVTEREVLLAHAREVWEEVQALSSKPLRIAANEMPLF